MRSLSPYVEQIKAIPILDVAKRLGLKVHGERIHCFNPKHEDRKTPSLHFNVAKNYFNCFGCEIGGSTVDLVVTATGCNRQNAMQWLAQEFAISHQRYEPLRRVRLRARTQSSEDHQFRATPKNKPDSEVYRWLLNEAGLPHRVCEYFLRRGLSMTTMTHFTLSGSLDPRALIRKAERLFGCERLCDAGLLTKSGKRLGETLPVWWEPIALIPFFWDSDAPIYLQARRLDVGDSRKYIGLSGIAKPMFNAQIIFTLKPGAEIYIVEGAMDAMAAYEVGLNAIGILGAKTKFKRTWAKALQNFQPVVVPDQDEAGQYFKTQVVEAFGEVGKSAEVRYLPSQYHDLTDALTAIKQGSL